MTTRQRKHDRLADLGWQALTITLAGLVFVDLVQSGFGSSAYLAISVALTLVACIAVQYRRTAPTAVAVVIVPLAAVTEMVGGASLAAVFSVAARRDRRTAALVALGHVVAPIPYTIVRSDSTFGVVSSNLFGAVLIGLALAWGTVVRTRRELVDSLRERAERAESEAALEADKSRWLERERIAREMHDVVAHRISLISLHAGALEVRPDSDADTISTATTIRVAAHDALDDLREILGVLRSDGTAMRPENGMAGLPELIQECREAGMKVSATVSDTADLDPVSSRTAFRVVQEGLTNARKHAPGVPVDLEVERDSDTVTIVVRNRVRAARPAGAATVPGTRSGLIGISERVRLAGGTVVHGIRTADRGREFAIAVRLPWSRT